MSFLVWLAPVLLAGAALAVSGGFQTPEPIAALLLVLLALLAQLLAFLGLGRRGRELAPAIVSVGAAALWVLCSLPVTVALASSAPSFDFLAGPVGALLRALGSPVEHVDGRLYLRAHELVAIRVDAEKLGLWPALWALVAVAAQCATLRRDRPWRTWLICAAVAAGLLLLRFAVLLILALQHPDPTHSTGLYPFATSVFLESRWLTLTLVPLAIVLGRFLPWSPLELELRSMRGPIRTSVAAAVLALLAGSGWAFQAGFAPSGPSRGGRVLIDELHSSGWSSALAPLDTEHFGRDTIYSSTAMVRFLSQYFDVEVHSDRAYDDGLLSDVDVLILKTSTAPFAAEEIDAIERFVEGGGGLYAIGDHTNLLGMTTNLNAVVERFGMRFRTDACNRLEDGQAAVWAPLPWAQHPTTAGVERLEFMTGCSIEVPPDADPTLLVRNVFSDPLDYSQPSFFGDVTPDLDDGLGPQVLAATREVGRGRVALFGDSTVFSTFCLTWEGRAEHLLQTIAWLDRGSLRSRVGWGVGLASLLSAAGLLLLSARIGGWGLGVAAPAGLVAGAFLGSSLAAAGNGATNGTPAPADPLPVAVLLESGCDFELPNPLVASDIPPERAFDGLYTFLHRVGCLPQIADLERGPAPDLAIALRPGRDWAAAQSKSLGRYVKAGGRLVVVSEEFEVLDEILAPFGMTPERGGEAWRAVAIRDSGGRLIRSDQPETQAVQVQFGRGTLVVVLRPSALSRAGLGDQLAAFELGDARWPLVEELEDLLGGRRSRTASQVEAADLAVD